MNRNNPLEELMLGRRRTSTDAGGVFAEATITKVMTDAAGNVSVAFRLTSQREYTTPAPCPSWQDAAALGAPNTHTHVMGGPKVGYRCLIVFVGADVSRPWCLSWAPQ